jgi:hypothetical protein
MKLSEFIESLKELPVDTEVEMITSGKSLFLGEGGFLVIQYPVGALNPISRNKLCSEFEKYGTKYCVIEYTGDRSPLEFLAIKKI